MHKLRQSNKRSDEHVAPSSASSGGSSSSVGSTSDERRSPGSNVSSPIPYKRQVLSPRVYPAFSPVTPATPDLMDIDLEEFGEISDLTHSWPLPRPISPPSTGSKGKGKGNEDIDLIGKGKSTIKEDLDLINKNLLGKGKGQKGRGSKVNDQEEEEPNQPIHSSQRVVPTHRGRRGKNLAALSRLQKEDLYFSTKPILPKEQDDLISSSDTNSGKPSTVTQIEYTSPKHNRSPTSSNQPKSNSAPAPNNMKTIDEKILQEIQSIQHPEARNVLEEADQRELQELAETICKSTEQELSAFVTRALDLSVANQVTSLFSFWLIWFI